MEKLDLEPSEEMKKQIYELYKILLDASFPEHKKIHLIDSLFLWEPWSWRVVGISTKAICKFSDNDFKTIKGLNRDHFIQSRSVTIKEMISELMPYEKWWKLFWENDQTNILTKEEHDNKRSIKTSTVVNVDWKLGFFACSKTVGFNYAKKEAEFLKTLIKENNIEC